MAMKCFLKGRAKWRRARSVPTCSRECFSAIFRLLIVAAGGKLWRTIFMVLKHPAPPAFPEEHEGSFGGMGRHARYPQEQRPIARKFWSAFQKKPEGIFLKYPGNSRLIRSITRLPTSCASNTN